ncbi:MAG: very short patch repair endonuclease, partial [Gammaproteobacteria bacterium]|nr:very short patch repair endonuclease [Gammaproteobacteria bacterium]
VAIFTHGCYWHQHKGCKLAYSDRSYSDKWKKKFDDNRQRDQRVLEQLTEQGWRVAVIWECVTRNEIELKKALNQLHAWIQYQDSQYFETDYKNT